MEDLATRLRGAISMARGGVAGLRRTECFHQIILRLSCSHVSAILGRLRLRRLVRWIYLLRCGGHSERARGSRQPPRGWFHHPAGNTMAQSHRNRCVVHSALERQNSLVCCSCTTANLPGRESRGDVWRADSTICDASKSRRHAGCRGWSYSQSKPLLWSASHIFDYRHSAVVGDADSHLLGAGQLAYRRPARSHSS